MAYLTREPIELAEFLGSTPSPQPSPSFPPKADPPLAEGGEGRVRGVGASILFLGIVREYSQGKEVLYLEYEAYEEMAERIIDELIRAGRHEFQVEEVKVLHRLGRVELGEIAVAIEVKSGHRDEAYQASRFLIEEIKHEVPIWKKEYFADGSSEWSQCPHVDLLRSA